MIDYKYYLHSSVLVNIYDSSTMPLIFIQSNAYLSNLTQMLRQEIHFVLRIVIVESASEGSQFSYEYAMKVN